jgi:hypothetical protein
MQKKSGMNRYALRSLSIIAVFVFFSFTGCRKEDTVYSRLVQQPGSELVIPGTLPDILHPHEKAAGMGLSAHKHMLIGKGLYHSRLSGNPGMVGGPIIELAELGLDIYFEEKGKSEQAKTEAELESINGQLASISGELASLNANLEALAAQISLDFTKLENFELALQAQTQFNYISDLYSSSSVSGLLYFSQTALEIKKGQSGTSWQALSAFWGNFANDAMNNTSGATASITALHGLISPNSATLQDGLLSKFAEQVIIQSNGTAQQPANVSAALGLLENYFTTIINYQFQALAVYGNVVNVVDTTGDTFREYLYGTFRQQIVDEINIYLNTVDFMVLNLADYRNKAQFAADMQYYQMAMAPDTTYMNGLARSRFIAALLYQSVDLKYSVINATVITPYDLTNGKETPVTSISGYIGGTNIPFTANASKYKSIYPYTKWSDSLAMPDNNWNFYSIQDTMYSGGSILPTMVINSPNAYHPWRHEQPIQGNIMVRYFNPEKPDPATATPGPTSTNTMQFGFTSWAWYWGFMRLSMYDFTERAYNPFLFFFHMSGPVIPIPNNISGFTWTDPGEKVAFPPQINGSQPPSFNPPPFMNNITYRGNVQSKPEGYINIALAYGVNYYLTPAPAGGSDVPLLYFSNVYAFQEKLAFFPMNFEIYSQRYDWNNASSPLSTLYDYNNRPEFLNGNGFLTTEMNPLTLASNQKYTEFNYMEAYNTNTPMNWGPGLMDFEYRWCTQYCYSFTYPYSEIFGK